MKDILVLISTNKSTFEDFRKWLFIKVNKDTVLFAAYGKSSNTSKTPLLIKYLEHKGTPILEALCYYYYKTNQPVTFQELQEFMIQMEFKRLELGLTLNYTPF